MRKILLGMALLSLIACTPASESDAIVCGLAVQAATPAADTVANVTAAEIMLATTPACLRLNQDVMAAIMAKVATPPAVTK